MNVLVGKSDNWKFSDPNHYVHKVLKQQALYLFILEFPVPGLVQILSPMTVSVVLPHQSLPLHTAPESPGMTGVILI